jgi:hypothetical protein
LFFPGSSSGKLAKTLEPKESDGGHLEIAPKQSKQSPKSQSFIRDKAPHTTRVPAAQWNRPSRRPVVRSGRWSSDRPREPERSFRGPGRERDRMSGRDGREGDKVSGRYSWDGREGDRMSERSGREGDKVSGRYSRDGREGDRVSGRFSRDGREGDRVSERYSREQTFGDGQAGKKVAESNDKRFCVAESYKHYLERQESRQSGKCSISCHKKAKI